MNSHLPSGFWSRSSFEFAGHTEFSMIDSTRKRIISSTFIQVDPIKLASISVWYQQSEPGIIFTCLKPYDNWRPNFYRIDGNLIYWRWSQDGPEYPWAQVEKSDVPDWFIQRMDRSYAKMDLQQQEAEQDAAANP